MQARLATLHSDWPRWSSCSESSSCSLQIVCALETKNPNESVSSVMPRTRAASLPRRLKPGPLAALGSCLESIRVLHSLAHERVVFVARRGKARDLEFLEHGRVLEGQQAGAQPGRDRGVEARARDPGLGHVLERGQRAQLPGRAAVLERARG